MPKRAISPKESSQPRGAVEPADHRIACSSGLVASSNALKTNWKKKTRDEGDHHRLVDGAADPGGAARRGHPFVAADDGDDRAGHRAHQHRGPEVGDRGVGEERREEAAEGLVVDQLGGDAGGEAEDDREDVEQRGDHHQRQEARHDQVLDRVDAEHLQGVELLADLPGSEVGGDRGAGDAGDDHGGDQRPDPADRGEDEEAAEPVERAEDLQWAGRLQARRAETEREGRDQQREPAELQREEELVDQLLAVGIGRPQRRPIVRAVRITIVPTWTKTPETVCPADSIATASQTVHRFPAASRP